MITTGTCLDKMEDIKLVHHYPVMYREVIDLLLIKNKNLIVDCTLGVGSLASKFFEVMNDDSFLIGIDKDESSLKAARQKLQLLNGRFALCKSSFSDVDKVLKSLRIAKADAFIFDLGISSYQLNNPNRGFSFLKDGPLDMRMDKDGFLSAYDLVNNLSQTELENIFKKFGEERYSKRIAQNIVKVRKSKSIETTFQLAQIVTDSVPLKDRYQRIHPSTRVFQALRIAVNRELESIELGLKKAISLLSLGGRIGVISFHSLEDRIVKNIFNDYKCRNLLRIITKKPLTPTESERAENNPSRSAKFRVAEKINNL